MRNHPKVSRVLRWCAVMVGAWATLAALDLVPSSYAAWRGELPRPFASPAMLENALGVRLGLPFYFPDVLEWPPSVVMARQRPLQTYLEVHPRQRPTGPAAGPLLVIRQWSGSAAHFHPPPDVLLAEGGRLPVRNGTMAVWWRAKDERGREWYRAVATHGSLTTELNARLNWSDFQRMVESLGP